MMAPGICVSSSSSFVSNAVSGAVPADTPSGTGGNAAASAAAAAAATATAAAAADAHAAAWSRRIDHKEIVAKFLTGISLRKVLSHLCNNASSGSTDPITTTVCIMLTCPIQLVVSEVGVALFKDHPNVLYPFSSMDVDQRYFVQRIVENCMHVYNICPALGNRVVMQMGGGCILYTDPCPSSFSSSSFSSSSFSSLSAAAAAAAGGGGGAERGGGARTKQGTASSPTMLQPIDVLRALCDCVFASDKFADPTVRYAITSILLQRILGAVVIPKDDQRAAFAYASECLASAASAKAQQPKQHSSSSSSSFSPPHPKPQ